MNERDVAIRLATSWLCDGKGDTKAFVANFFLDEVSRTEKLEARIGKLRDRVKIISVQATTDEYEDECDEPMDATTMIFSHDEMIICARKALEEDGKE